MIIRSLIPHLSGIAVDWKYTARAAVGDHDGGHLGPALMGRGGMGSDFLGTWRLLSGRAHPGLDSIVDACLRSECSAFWVVAHNEGLRVAHELATRQSTRPVHLTVHDDWAGALCARSRRYRLLAPWARSLTRQTLGRVRTFDVVSVGMRDHYQQLTGLGGAVVHRYLPPSALLTPPAPVRIAGGELLAGHVGSVYDDGMLFDFLRAFDAQARQAGFRARLRLWGSHLTAERIPPPLRAQVSLLPTLPETEVISALAKCHFVYAAYPFARRLRLFSRTSLPTKLSTYLQAGRPILGHGPADSTLADFLGTTATGVMWTDQNREAGQRAVAKTLGMEIGPGSQEHARQQFFGEKNLVAMRRAFLV